ncbi:MAG TPA: flavin reductase family protein [Actinomycetota bacterium]|nr:flavin reductase family protein [Actinomycetota bacterium]
MGFVEIDPASELEGRRGYFVLTSLVVPRPIAWISTISPEGRRNLAPHSYFNVMSARPMILHFTSTGVKDTLTNVRNTGEFVVNIVDVDVVRKMNVTAADFPPGEDEFDWAGLTAAPSTVVKPPRVEEAKAAFECRLRDVVSMGEGNMAFGEVVRIHIDEAILSDGRIDVRKLNPVGRLGGSGYVEVAKGLFELKRPRYDDLKGSGPQP